MGHVHRSLGLTVGLVQRGMTAEERRSNYSCDITYTNNSELGFDYLRDNLAGNSEHLVMKWPKPFHFAIVHEVDSVLIDEGRNPLLISGEINFLLVKMLHAILLVLRWLICLCKEFITMLNLKITQLS